MNSSYDALISNNKRMSTKELKYCLENLNDDNREKILLGNLGLIAKISHKRAQSQEEFDMYFSSGIESMIRAIDLFDIKHTYKAFGTFAYRIINHDISACNRTTIRVVHVPDTTFLNGLKARKEIEDLEIELQKTLSDEEILEKTSLSRVEIASLSKNKPSHLSLNQQPNNPNSDDLEDIIGLIPEENLLESRQMVDKILTEEYMRKAIGKLKPLYKKVLWLRYYENKTYHEIGQATGYSKERIRQFLTEIKDILREKLTKDNIDSKPLKDTFSVSEMLH